MVMRWPLLKLVAQLVAQLTFGKLVAQLTLRTKVSCATKLVAQLTIVMSMILIKVSCATNFSNGLVVQKVSCAIK